LFSEASAERKIVAGAVKVELVDGDVKVMVGVDGIGAALTVKLAILLVTLPEALVMTHSNSVPLLAVVVAAVV